MEIRQSRRIGWRAARCAPLLHGAKPADWRELAFSEYDYSMLPAGIKLKVEPRDARLFMVADKRWKYVHAIGYRPMLFDLQTDPNEFRDLGADPAFENERRRLVGGFGGLGFAAVAAHRHFGRCRSA